MASLTDIRSKAAIRGLADIRSMAAIGSKADNSHSIYHKADSSDWRAGRVGTLSHTQNLNNDDHWTRIDQQGRQVSFRYIRSFITAVGQSVVDPIVKDNEMQSNLLEVDTKVED